MELKELLEALLQQNNKGGGYQIHLNSGNLEEVSKKEASVEFSDLYFTECSALKNTSLLCFGNENRKPVGQKDDGTNLYPVETNSSLFINVSKIEAIEVLEDFEDWFSFPSEKVINIYMFPENNALDGNRNILTIGFME